MRIVCFYFFVICSYVTVAQKTDHQRIEQLTDLYFSESVETLRDWLRLPNYGRSMSDIEKNLDWCSRYFQELDFNIYPLVSDTVPHLFADKIIDPSMPTVLFYLQIDGQPVDESLWHQPDPFDPVLKICDDPTCDTIPWSDLSKWQTFWKIYARSASDSKGPAMAFLSALYIMHRQEIKPAFNIKVIMDFQEELGSPTLPALVNREKALFTADAMLIMDGTRHPSNLPTLTFGARGIATLQLTVYGANKDLHSGQYGNFAPNPAFDLAHLLSSMKNSAGVVTIPGYYNGIDFSEDVTAAKNSAYDDEAAMMKELGIIRTDSIGRTYQEALQFPSFNIRGLSAGWTGAQVRTVIPATAVAEIDMRLVPETPAERQIQLVKNHIRAQGFHMLDEPPTEVDRRTYPKLIMIQERIGSSPFRTDIESPLGQFLELAMVKALDSNDFIKMQSTGGSQPIAPFVTALNIPAVSVRIPNPNNNIHAPNENLQLGNYYEGIQMCLAILTQPYISHE